MAKDYKDTILRDRPEFAGRSLFVADPNGPGVLLDCKKRPVTIYIDPTSGEAEFQGLDAKSLRDLGRRVFGWDDPAVPTVLSRLITPEMEIERVFNCYRYKYVRALSSLGRPRDWVADRLTAGNGNELFTALIDGTFRADTGGAWKKQILARDGFAIKALPENFDNEDLELRMAQKYFLDEARKAGQEEAAYRELVAIKPGFHERWYLPGAHVGYNEEVFQESMKRKKKYGQATANLRRSIVLLSFHGVHKNEKPDFRTASNELGKYRQYSQCHATEGPCFARRWVKTNLRDLLPEAANADSVSGAGHDVLEKQCLVFDYRKAICEEQQSVNIVLKQMEPFTHHSIRWE